MVSSPSNQTTHHEWEEKGVLKIEQYPHCSYKYAIADLWNFILESKLIITNESESEHKTESETDNIIGVIISVLR